MKLTLAVALAICLSACSKHPAPELEHTQSSAPATPIDPATAGSIKGTVYFDGAVPAPKEIDMSADPFCKGANRSESLVVDAGRLANVFVYVKDGLGNRSFEVPKQALVVDQNGCRYVPHVAGVIIGQTIEFRNSDPTVHNIHPSPQTNAASNQSQQPKDPPLHKAFDYPEIMVPVKCNQHPWMKMYLNVVDNPFFAVSGSNGSYEIRGLPPGDYTIDFVHEKLGEQQQKVSVKAKESVTSDVRFHE